jgi:hypothetical protein
MKYIYVVDEGSVMRYDIDTETWITLPSDMPTIVSTGVVAQLHNWKTVDGILYAILGDGKLYKATPTETDLVWEGPLLSGHTMVSMGINVYSYSMESLDGLLYFVTTSNNIYVYDPEVDSVIETISIPTTYPSPFTLATISYDGTSKFYIILSSDNDNHEEIRTYDIDAGTFADVKAVVVDLPGTVAIRPVNSFFIDGFLFVISEFSTLFKYNPDTDTWTPQPPTTNIGQCCRFGDSAICSFSYTPGGPWHAQVFVNSTGTWAGLVNPPTPPTNRLTMGVFPLGAVQFTTPLPGSVFPDSWTVSKRIDHTEDQNSRGAIAPESTYDEAVVYFKGALEDDDSQILQDLREEILLWAEETVQLEVLPGRYCFGNISNNTLDPKFTGVVENYQEFTFELHIPDGMFYDYEGNSYRTP